MDITKENRVATKPSFDHNEGYNVTKETLFDPEVEGGDERKAAELRRRVDWRLIPVLTVLYLASYIDRSNSTCIAIAET